MYFHHVFHLIINILEFADKTWQKNNLTGHITNFFSCYETIFDLRKYSVAESMILLSDFACICFKNGCKRSLGILKCETPCGMIYF